MVGASIKGLEAEGGSLLIKTNPVRVDPLPTVVAWLHGRGTGSEGLPDMGHPYVWYTLYNHVHLIHENGTTWVWIMD